MILSSKGKTQILTLDNSALRDFRTCPRRGQHSHLDWKKPRRGLLFGPEPEPEHPIEISFGLAAHRALDAWWRGASPQETEALFLQEFSPPPGGKDRLRTPSMGIQLLRNYTAAWILDREQGFTLLSTETIFKHFLGKWTSPRGTSWKFYYTGRIDKTLRRIVDGKMGILDHKTTTRDGLTEAYQVDRGFLGYLWAAKKLWGETPFGLIADIWVLRAAGPMPVREFIPWSSAKIREWKSGVVYSFQWIAGLLEEVLLGDNPWAFPQFDTGCRAYWRPCPYLPLCRAPEERIRLLQTQYQEKGPDHLTGRVE